MIEIYPKITIYCPKEGKEINGNKCLVCEFFKGISVNDFELTTVNKSSLYFRCFQKNEAGEKNE